ncbi:MAG: glycosyltransferase [Candidatus Aenigmatarchaeota archaeon]
MKYFTWILIEKNKRNLEQILETDNDALRYSIKKFCLRNKLEPIFIYILDKKIDKNFQNFLFLNKNIKSFLKIIKVVKKSKIIYINTQGLLEFFLAYTFRLLNKKAKLIYHFHGVFKIDKINFFKKIFYKFYLSIFDIIINDVESEKKKVKIFLKKDKSMVFTYGSNLKPVKPKKHSKLTLVFVGRISKEKEIEKIIFGIKPFGKKIRLIIIGGVEDEKYYRYLKKIAKDLDVEFTGFLNKKEIQEKFSISDIFVNLRSDEVFGRVFVEALSSGLPVIGNKNSPGPREIIKNCENGWLIKNHYDLTELLKKLKKEQIRYLREKCIKSSYIYSYEKSYKSLKFILSQKR